MESVKGAFRVSRRTLAVLEWSSVTTQLASRAKTPVGREYCLAWMPGKLPEKSLATHAEAVLTLTRWLGDTSKILPLADIPETSDILRRIERSGTISVEEFGDLIRSVKASQSLHHFLAKHATTAPALHETLKGTDLLEDWSRKHFPLLDNKGEIVDAASEDLRALRKMSLDLHRKIQDRLKDFLHNPKISEVMQDLYVTVRDGRYVLPVKTSFRSRVPGIIHDVSATEATLFIEPQEVVDSNNQLKVVEREIQAEIERILAAVVEATKPFAPSLRKNRDVLARADLLSAASEFAGAWGPRVCAPEWRDSKGLNFRELAHPLLALHRKVVPNSIGWDGGLVLSGPNTGGKTVLLKSVGLGVCFAWAGLPVPAQEFQIPKNLQGLSADIGDDQDLERNLSTFSAHLAVLKELLADCQPGDLSLIDEIATGTSPEEGEPLAQAVLEHLLSAGARFLVTTHYRSLKHFAMSDERVRIAAMAFDRMTRTPTYEIIPDIPGESSALETAEQLGVPADIIKRARALRGDTSEDLEKAVQRLEKARKIFEEREREALAAKARSDDEAKKLREKINDYEQKQKEGLAAEAKETLKQLHALRDELAEAVKGAQSQDLAAGASKLFTKISDAGEQTRGVVDAANKGQGPLPLAADADIVVDAVLDIDGLGLGTVLEVPRDISAARAVVVVQVGDLRTRVVRSRLRKPPTDRVRAFETHRAANVAARERNIEKAAEKSAERGASARTSNLICDVRGKGTDEAMRRLDPLLNELFRGASATITCIHGHGSDRLKDTIRNYLSKERQDLVYRPGSWPGEGGDGVTIIERRNA